MIMKSEKGIKFLTTEQIKASIESIVRNSSEFLTIICAYLVIPNEHIEYLPKIKQVNLIGGKEDTISDQEAELKKKIPRVNIKFVKNLHAKCYMNESTILLPSMNLNKYYNPTYDISKDNIEFGLEIHRNEAEELYESIKKEINSIKDFVFENDCSEQKVTSFLKKEEISQNQDMHIRFLKTYGIMSSVKDVITSAKESIMIVSPYLDVSEDCLGCLRSTPVKKNLLFGKNDMQKPQKEELKRVRNLCVHYINELHAKCYLNEEKAIVTSMNLLQSSEKNIEIGIEIYKENNPSIYNQIEAWIHSLIDKADEAGKNDPDWQKTHCCVLKRGKAGKYDINWYQTRGYCLWCGEDIPWCLNISNEDVPLCDSCKGIDEIERDRELFPNAFIKGPYCHRCRKNIDKAKYFKVKDLIKDLRINQDHPLCIDCWKAEKPDNSEEIAGSS